MPSRNRTPYLAIVGPTCSGKTKSVEGLIGPGCERVNLDSFQLYDFFRVGTGRSDVSTGHLYGVLDPHEDATDELYLGMVAQVLGSMANRDIQPVFEGGSRHLLKALASEYALKIVGVLPPHTADLDQLVKRRVDAAGQDNLIDEAREGLRRGYRDTTVMRGDVVYLPLVQHIDEELTKGEAFEKIHQNLVNMHHRQMAGYLAMPEIEWVESPA